MPDRRLGHGTLEEFDGVRGDDPELIPYEGTHQDPRGGVVEKAYIGETRMFDSEQIRQAQYMVGKGNKTLKRNVDGDFAPNFLHWHVPRELRGNYKIPMSGGELGERVGPAGYAMCMGLARKGSNDPADWKLCQAKAVNRSGFCSKHGGALCPLDRLRIDWSKAPRHIRFKFGKLPIDELDDEELAKGQIRKPNGSFTDNQYVSAEIHQQMTKRLFERADTKMREGLMDMVETMMEIANGTAYEPADRLRAAEFVFKWLRGNQPVKVEIGMDKPFEQVMSAVISGGSRSESRQRRGLEDAIDAEVVEDEDLDLPDIDVSNVEAEEDDFTPTEYDYTDPRDHTLNHDLLPQYPRRVGAAGKVMDTKLPPDDMEQRQRWNEDYRDNTKESELRREKVFRKKKSPQEVAAERKEHRDAVQAQLKKRKAFQNMGHSNLPVPLEYELVRAEDSEGEFEPEDDYQPEEGDVLTWQFKLQEGMRDAT